MMLSWRSQDNIQLVTTCNPQWLHMCEFMLLACRRFINNVVNSRTELWTQKCATWTLAHFVFVLLFMGTRHIPVCNIIAWLYVYACICMIVRVWLYDNVGMMPWWRTQDHIHVVTTCHPTWLHLYQFMFVEIPGKVPGGSNADTLLSSGGSAADTCWGSWPCFLYHCAAPLHACMCMIVYKTKTFKLLGIHLRLLAKFETYYVLDSMRMGWWCFLTTILGMRWMFSHQQLLGTPCKDDLSRQSCWTSLFPLSLKQFTEKCAIPPGNSLIEISIQQFHRWFCHKILPP